jgi:YfiH family protein
MIQQTFSALTLSRFSNLAQFDSIMHYVSERSGGVSRGEIGTLNLSFSAGDDPEHVKENRSRIAQALGITSGQLVFPSQTHSDRVQVVDTSTKPEQLTQTDALITRTPGLCISVMSADCVPVRGTVSKILTKTVLAMQRHFGSAPENLVAGIGPSICPEVYEVGEEVLAAAAAAFDSTEAILSQNGNGKGYFNLWEANRLQLLAMGVPAASIEVASICTYQNSHRFFSARKSGSKAGRFAAGILLKK